MFYIPHETPSVQVLLVCIESFVFTVFLKLPEIQNKERMLRVAREKCQILCRAVPQSFKARRAGSKNFQVLKEKTKSQVKLLHPAKVFFKTDREIEVFVIKRNQRSA